MNELFEGPFTVFAPGDRAFRSVSSKLVAALKKNPYLLRKLLLAHIIPGRVYASAIMDRLSLNSALRGHPLVFHVNDTEASVSGAEILSVDIETDNGVIHVIDSVINPWMVSLVLQ